jgi:transcriptional regulator with XRE-family HTH domain
MARRPITDTTISQRITDRRQLLGYSMRYAADRAGVSASTWSRIERGLVSADNRFTLAAVAEALRCSMADLAGLPLAPTDRPSAEASGAVHETVRAVVESDLRYPPTTKAGPLAALLPELDLVIDLRGRCDFVGAAKRLPDLIRALHAASFGTERLGALRSLVLAADAANVVVRYSGEPAAACLVAERAQQAAEALEDPVMLGLAAWARSHAAIGCGLYQQGKTIADQAADAVRPHLKRPDAAEMYGALLLQTAFGARALGDVDEGEVRLVEVEQVAERTGDSLALDLSFGPTNVKFWRIAMETDGGDPGRAVTIARATNPTAIPRVLRQATFYLDTGRALARIGKDQEAVRMLLTAERMAPQRLRNCPTVTETARALLERARRNATGAELRGFCERLGVAT